MQTRKVQLTGGSTYTVSLPKAWADDIDLSPGDTVSLFPREKTLLVEPNTGSDDWEISLDIGDCSTAVVRRTVQALYTSGFDRVTLESPTGLGDGRRVITSTARNLIGLETIDADETGVTLQTLLDSGTVSVEQSTMQLRQVALSMHQEALDALLAGEEMRAEHVIERDEQVDRLYAMISRHFQRSLVSLRETDVLELDQADLYDYQTTARQLERVADHAEKIARLTGRLEAPPEGDLAADLRTHASDARGIVERATSTILADAAVETAHDAIDDRDTITAELDDLERTLHDRPVVDGHLIALAIDSLRRTADYGANVAETALQSAARDRRL